MSAGPTIAAGQSVRLSGWWHAALNLFSFTPDCVLPPVLAPTGAYQRLMRVRAVQGGSNARDIIRTISLRAGEGGFNRNEPGVSNLPCATPFQLRNNSFYNFIKFFRGVIPSRLGSAVLHIVYGRLSLSPIRDECRPVAFTKILVGPDYEAFKFINTLGCNQALEIFDLNNVSHADQHGVEAFARDRKSFAGKTGNE